MGASQILPYVEKVAAAGVEVTLHSFEQLPAPAALRDRLASVGIIWDPHRFRMSGSLGGLSRVAQGARLVRGSSLVHARSDLPAASALLARTPSWVWDVRSFWADQRIAMGTLARGSPEERVLRAVESMSASRAAAIVTLTKAAIDVLVRRHGEDVRERATVIPTCVDTARFALTPFRDKARLQLVLSGSFNPLYDLETTLGLVAAIRRRRPADLTMIRPGPSLWDGPILEAGGCVESAKFTDMPARLQDSTAGLSILRPDDSDALAGCVPTKLAEFLATGRPVVVNRRLGDMDELLSRYHCGVVVADRSQSGLSLAAEELCALIDDDETPARCRKMAMEHFDLELGVASLMEVYRSVGRRIQ